MKKKIVTLTHGSTLLVGICLLFCIKGYSQLAVLRNVQENRFAGETYLRNEKYDSAYFAMSRVVVNEKYSNPYDNLNFSLCNYEMKDTAGFLKYLSKAIEDGVDTERVRSSGLRKLTGNDKMFLESYLNANYDTLRKKGWQRYDTALIKEVNSIEDLDQYTRRAMMQLKGWDANPEYKYLMYLQQQADSINYVRVAKLIEEGKFPGYHNCGYFASISIALIHLGDYHEYQWDYLFSHLKEEALTGNLKPIEVATIADNHYERGRGKLCSYYGHWISRSPELCDCKEVDKRRAAIGLGDLQAEYKATGKTLPECYQAGR